MFEIFGFGDAKGANFLVKQSPSSQGSCNEQTFLFFSSKLIYDMNPPGRNYKGSHPLQKAQIES